MCFDIFSNSSAIISIVSYLELGINLALENANFVASVKITEDLFEIAYEKCTNAFILALTYFLLHGAKQTWIPKMYTQVKICLLIIIVSIISYTYIYNFVIHIWKAGKRFLTAHTGYIFLHNNVMYGDMKLEILLLQ